MSQRRRALPGRGPRSGQGLNPLILVPLRRYPDAFFSPAMGLNADFKLNDHFFGGFGLQTNNAADSANQTFTQSFDNYGLYIDKACLGYAPVDGVTLLVGKQANPSQALLNEHAFNGNQRDELVLRGPADITLTLGNWPIKLYWDLAYNTRGVDRWNHEYGPIFSAVTYNAARTAVNGYLPSSRLSPSPAT